MTKKEVLEKIKKCLALSASSNEHEAETAMRQARALMEKHGIDDADVLAAGAGEHKTTSSVQSTPPNWETMLANYVARGFGCKLIFSPGWFHESGNWKFIGVGAAPEIAAYAFAVLYRQLKRQRTEHIKTKLKRCKTATKTRRADLFCEGWVHAAAGKIAALAGTPEQDQVIAAYVDKHYPSLSNLNSRDRNDGRKLNEHEYADYHHGSRGGQNAELNRGMGVDRNAGLLK